MVTVSRFGSLLFASLAFVACALPASRQADAAPTILDEKLTTAAVQVGQRFEIQLASNRTTGYSWQLEQRDDLKGVDLLSSEYVAERTDRVGAGGVERWVFVAKTPGRTSLRFTYARPWEKGTQPAREMEFTIDSRP